MNTNLPSTRGKVCISSRTKPKRGIQVGIKLKVGSGSEHILACTVGCIVYICSRGGVYLRINLIITGKILKFLSKMSSFSGRHLHAAGVKQKNNRWDVVTYTAQCACAQSKQRNFFKVSIETCRTAWKKPEGTKNSSVSYTFLCVPL